MYKKVVVTGSLAYDHIMSMPDRFGDHIMPDKLHILNVSFIMNTFRQEFGGTGGNISYSLALLKSPNILVGSVGDDFGNYRKHLKKFNNIDISRIKTVKSKKTARGFVITDQDDNQIWGFYQGAMPMSSKIKIWKLLDKNMILMIAPNDPVATINFAREAKASGTSYIFDPAFNIPHLSKRDLKFGVENAEILIGNDYEVELVRRRLRWTKKELVKRVNIVITTLGPKGARIEKDGKKIIIPPAKPKNASDPTGAGDAFRAGFLAGYVRDFSLEVCGRMGAVSAVYTVEKYGTQTHKFKIPEFIRRYKDNFGEDLRDFPN